MLTIELVFRMTPPPCSFITLAAAWAQLNTAFTFRAMVPANSSGLYSYRLPLADTPALFTMMSSLPKDSFTVATAFSTSWGFCRLGQSPITLEAYSGFSAFIFCSALSTVSCRDPHSATDAPLSRYSFTIA